MIRISEGWKLRKGVQTRRICWDLMNWLFSFGLKDFSAFLLGVVFFWCCKNEKGKARRHFWAQFMTTLPT